MFTIEIKFGKPSNSFEKQETGTSLVVQWLKLGSKCREPGFDPRLENYIPCAAIKSSNATPKDQEL